MATSNFNIDPLSYKVSKGFSVSGWVVHYDVLSTNVIHYVDNPACENVRERILKGAFSESLETDDILMCVNHDLNYILGSTKRGNLFFRDHPDKLFFVCHGIPGDTVVMWDGALRTIKSFVTLPYRDIGVSFNFDAKDESWGDVNGVQTRTIVKAKLNEISIVNKPIYTEATAEVI